MVNVDRSDLNLELLGSHSSDPGHLDPTCPTRDVNKGQVLFEIDPRPFKAALDQAKAQLAHAEAQLSKLK